MKSEINEVSTQETDISDTDSKVTTPEGSQPKPQKSDATADVATATAAAAPSGPNGSELKEEIKPAAAQEGTGGTSTSPEGATPEEKLEAESALDEEICSDDTSGDAEAAEESPEQKRIAELEEKLSATEARAEEMFERLQRTTAEFQNSQRRREKQALDQMDRANARLIERLLPVLDDFELAFRNMPEEFSIEDNSWVTGLQQIDKKLQRILEDESVTPMEPTGEFDPNRHEAVSSEPNEEVESGHIIETLRTGYEYKGRVMRPALVRVAL